MGQLPKFNTENDNLRWVGQKTLTPLLTVKSAIAIREIKASSATWKNLPAIFFLFGRLLSVLSPTSDTFFLFTQTKGGLQKRILYGTIPILRQEKDWLGEWVSAWVGGSSKWPVLMMFSTVFTIYVCWHSRWVGPKLCWRNIGMVPMQKKLFCWW